MELFPGIGIGPVAFGLLPDEVIETLGQPDRVELDEDYEDSLSYQYNHLKLRLTFYERTDGRLGYIRCAHPNLNYRSSKVIGQPINKAQYILKKSRRSWQLESYEFFDAYFNEQHWLTLNVEYGAVISLELGLPFDEVGNYIWPQRGG